VTTAFTSEMDTLSVRAHCWFSTWDFSANSSQLIQAAASSTEGLDVYLTSMEDHLSWMMSQVCDPPKSVQLLFTAKNVTSITMNYLVPLGAKPNAFYSLAFRYYPQSRSQPAARLTVTIWIASREVKTATTTIYSTSFEEYLYSTVGTLTTSTVTTEQSLSQYSVPIGLLVAVVVVVGAGYWFARRRRR
jgi:hypothetical protein